jgi:hypothetical protein
MTYTSYSSCRIRKCPPCNGDIYVKRTTVRRVCTGVGDCFINLSLPSTQLGARGGDGIFKYCHHEATRDDCDCHDHNHPAKLAGDCCTSNPLYTLQTHPHSSFPQGRAMPPVKTYLRGNKPLAQERKRPPKEIRKKLGVGMCTHTPHAHAHTTKYDCDYYNHNHLTKVAGDCYFGNPLPTTPPHPNSFFTQGR